MLNVGSFKHCLKQCSIDFVINGWTKLLSWSCPSFSILYFKELSAHVPQPISSTFPRKIPVTACVPWQQLQNKPLAWCPPNSDFQLIHWNVVLIPLRKRFFFCFVFCFRTDIHHLLFIKMFGTGCCAFFEAHRLWALWQQDETDIICISLKMLMSIRR